MYRPLYTFLVDVKALLQTKAEIFFLSKNNRHASQFQTTTEMPKRKAEAEPSMSDLMTLVKTLVDQNKVLEGKLEQQTDQLNQLKQGQGALAQNQAVFRAEGL